VQTNRVTGRDWGFTVLVSLAVGVVTGMMIQQNGARLPFGGKK
jgi:hypothetical protein